MSGSLAQQKLPPGVAWVKTNIKKIPKNAYVGGWEDGGKRHVYIGRAGHHGSLITGKTIPFWGGMFFPLGHEVKNTSFEVLVADNPSLLRWVPASGNHVPNGAIQGGYQGGDPLYLARGRNPIGEPTPGKLHPPYGFFLSWGGGEHHPHEYEVLVCDGMSGSQQPPAPIPQPALAQTHNIPQLPKGAAWVRTDIHSIPKNAFVGGWEDGGKRHVFVGRAEHSGMLITGKAIPFWGGMFFPLGHEVRNTSFEVLVTDNPSMFKWVAASGNSVPKNAVQGGFQGNDPIYVARGINPAGEPTPGKLHPPYGCFLSWGGKEHHRKDYEVLTCDGMLTAPNVGKEQPSATPKVGADTDHPKKQSQSNTASQPGQPVGHKDKVSWVPTTGNEIPTNAVVGGTVKSTDLYIGRANHQGHLIPGKVSRPHKKLFYPLMGKELSTSSYEILVTNNPSAIQWVPASNGHVPQNAFQAGSQGKDSLYIARAKAPGIGVCPGKLHPPHGFFFSLDGKERKETNYEVLVVTVSSDLDKGSDSIDTLNEKDKASNVTKTLKELSVDKPSEEKPTDIPCVE